MAERKQNGLDLSAAEIRASMEDLQTLYPPILNVKQAAELTQLPVQTLYQMSSQGRFSTCARKVGKHLRFFRDRLIQAIFN